MVLPDLSGLFTESGLISFGLGVLSARAWTFARDRYLDKADPEHSPHHHAWKTTVIAWSLTVLVIGFIGFKTQEAHTLTTQNAAASTEFAKSVQLCQREFNTVFRERAAFNDQEDRLAAEERVALSAWLTELLNPPSDIAFRFFNDPVRQDWAQGVTANYQNKISAVEVERTNVERERAAHVLPEPTCGQP